MSVCVSTCRAEMGSQEGWRDEAEAEKIERRAMMGKAGTHSQSQVEAIKRGGDQVMFQKPLLL